ncbi:MAG: glycosyltransferase family 39 protein, partial [Elusimicrobiota bacterium]|nr:glycosyltransferase family 39 protein [Elusimicrobiota bacterium]
MAKNKKIIAGLLLACFFLISVASFTQKSLTFDEIQHLSSGYATLKTGNFYIGPGHPPLMRLWAALSLSVMNPGYPHDHKLLSRNRKYWWLSVGEDYRFGHEFLYKSGNNPEKIVFASRLMCVILGVFLGVLVYLFSKKLFGWKAGLFSLFLFSFSPTVIAHSRLVMNDIAGAAGITLSLLLYLRYIEKKTWTRFIVVSLAVFLALMLKYNAVFILPVLFLGFLFTEKLKGFGKFVLILLALILALNIFYGFKGTFGKKDIEYNLFKKMAPDKMSGRAVYSAYINFPLPERFMQSFSNLLIHNKRGHSSFVAGKYHTAGSWNYFPLAFLIKTPFLTILLIAVLVYVYIKKRKL